MIAVQRAKAGAHLEGKGGHIFGADAEGVAVDDVGVDARFLPVLLQTVDRHPFHAVVTQGVGGESNLSGDFDATLLEDFGEAFLDLDLGIGVVLVPHAGADDVFEFQAFLFHVAGHDVGGLLLFVLLPAVGDGRALVEVGRVFRRVVEPPKLLFPPCGLGFLGENVLINGGFRKSGARGGRGPDARVMRRHVPGRRAAHRETADGDAVVVDAIAALGVFEGLEGVDLPGELHGVAIAAVGMQDEGVLGRELPGFGLSLGDEPHFAQLVVPPMVPDVEAMPPLPGRIVGCGDHQAVGLGGTVDPGSIAAHDESGRGRPGSPAGAERLGPFEALLQQLLRRGDIALGIEDVLTDNALDGIVIDFNVGDQVEGLGLVPEGGPEPVEAPFQLARLPGQLVCLLPGDVDSFGGDNARGRGCGCEAGRDDGQQQDGRKSGN